MRLPSLGLLFLFLLAADGAPAASFKDEFAVVFIDAATEAELGPFPYDRSLYAKAIWKAHELGARAVVLKFFIDLPKEAKSDHALAESMKAVPVILQARLLDETQEPNPNPLPDRFTLPGVESRTGVSGMSGWLPLPMLSANAADIGFVDFASTRIPLLETHRAKTVKSLVVCCIETATGHPATFEPDGTIHFGEAVLKTDDHQFATAVLPGKDTIDYIPFHEFLKRESPDADIEGKIVIIGYDGPKIHEFPTPIGPIRAHRCFIHSLRSVYEQVAYEDGSDVASPEDSNEGPPL